MDVHAPVSEIMTRVVAQIEPTASAEEAARLMRSRHVSGLPVIGSNGRLVGVLSEIDIVRGIHQATGAMSPRGFLDIVLGSTPASGGPGLLESSRARLKNARVSEFMSDRVVTVDPDTTLREAVRLLRQHGISRLPVVDDKRRVIGIVTKSDLLGAVEDRPSRSRGGLTPAPRVGRAGKGTAAPKGPTDPYGDI
ncbi:MAG TPA: CBS domain-containing protein [Thermoplasmata archaeon]|nr:CBS domain-containing protein [Thermoplasmata archaeon]